MKHIDHNLKVYASRQTPSFRNRVDLFPIWTRHGEPSWVKEIIWEVMPEAVAISQEAPLHLDYSDAQFLMDQLWECGLRPSEGAGSAGSLAATERHLKDLQRIVFEKPQV